MDKSEIGRLIGYERNKQGITLQGLAYGLCSVPVLRRLESGERMIDYFTLERMMERLGKSMNKMAILFDEDSYKILYLREIIEKDLESKNYEEIREALDYYETLKEADTAIHRQYILKMRAFLMDEEQKREKLEFLEKALKETVPDFQLKEIEKYYLGGEELMILLQWGELKIRLNELSLEMVGPRFMTYVQKVCQDEEVEVNLMTKVSWVFSTLEMEQKNYKSALAYALEGERVLAENKVILHLPQFLDRILELTEKEDKAVYQEWKEQRDALKKFYEEYDQRWTMGQVELWKKFRQQEVHLISETFERARSLRKQSQECVADELDMDQKTISRIETGKFKPKTSTFHKLKNYYQIDRDIYSTQIVVEDFSLLELEREISKICSERKWQEARALYESLKSRLSMKHRENLQYVRYRDMFFAHRLGEITNEEAKNQCVEAFRITREEVTTLEQVERLILSKNEGLLLDYIAGIYDREKKYDISTRILESVVKGYESSKIDVKHHYIVLGLVYPHLAFSYDGWNKFDEALIWADKAISFDFKCGRGMNLGYIREEKQYILDQMEGTFEKSKENHMQCILILKVLRKEHQRIILEQWYNNCYKN